MAHGESGSGRGTGADMGTTSICPGTTSRCPPPDARAVLLVILFCRQKGYYVRVTMLVKAWCPQNKNHPFLSGRW